jgi:hypothetical protein
VPKITWDDVGIRFYESGVDRGVLYVGANPGVSWSGLVSVSESVSGGEAKPFFFEGIKYLNYSSPEDFEATIEAFTYPDEFAECDGTQVPLGGLSITNQRRRSFGFSYRTQIGNDTNGSEHGYKIHLVYNALAEPSARDNRSIGESADPNNFSWKITTRPVIVENFRRTSHIIIDSRFSAPEALAVVESIIYGSDEEAARLPTTAEVFEIFTENATFVVTDNGDGTWTATGPDYLIQMIDAVTFQIESPTAIVIDEDTYTLSSSS